MRRRSLMLALVAVLAYEAVLGVARLVDAEQGPARPEYVGGISPAEREAQARRAQAVEAQRIAGLVIQFAREGRDPRGLEQVLLPSLEATPSASFTKAVRGSELIVVGTVRALHFGAPEQTRVTFAVERALKGQAGDEVTIAWPGGLRTEGDGSYALVLAVSPDVPPLFQGDRAVLFLSHDPEQSDVYRVQGSTGHYAIVHGLVRTVAGSPFARRFAGQSEVVLIEAVLAEVRERSFLDRE